MSAMPTAVRKRFDTDLTRAAEAVGAGRHGDAWTSLEEAHVLSQPWAFAHVRVHRRMLTLALRTRDRTEAVGQVLRLAVAAPGSLAGRYPVGNTGRADVGLTQPMPMAPDLAALLRGQGSA